VTMLPPSLRSIEFTAEPSRSETLRSRS
jgi:hypothetical protein